MARPIACSNESEIVRLGRTARAVRAKASAVSWRTERSRTRRAEGLSASASRAAAPGRSSQSVAQRRSFKRRRSSRAIRGIRACTSGVSRPKRARAPHCSRKCARDLLPRSLSCETLRERRPLWRNAELPPKRRGKPWEHSRRFRAEDRRCVAQRTVSFACSVSSDFQSCVHRMK